MRLYAIGDVHGCLEELSDVLSRIERDLTERPPGDWRLILLGDYIDRGPDSASVIGTLTELSEEPRVISLCGNHDRLMIDALAGDARMRDVWLGNGGDATLRSYGVVPEPRLWQRDGPEALVEELRQVLPEKHFRALEGLKTEVSFGDYRFAHAGVNPQAAWDAQTDHDLIWIREPFLSWDEPLPQVVIHGHTPCQEVEVRPHRIGLDTGAVFGGPLSCVVLEASSVGLLTDGGLRGLIES